jgi:hypothetical protein
LTVEKFLVVVRAWLFRFAGLVRREPNDRELERELALHLELEEEALRDQGHSPETAARVARVRLGRRRAALEALRDQRSLPWVATLGMDVRLGLRMLRKHWGLTLVGGLAMTVAIVENRVVRVPDASPPCPPIGGLYGRASSCHPGSREVLLRGHER